jgi:hypothetical protein
MRSGVFGSTAGSLELARNFAGDAQPNGATVAAEQHIRWKSRHDSGTVFTVGATTAVLNTASGFADTSISVSCPDGYIDSS